MYDGLNFVIGSGLQSQELLVFGVFLLIISLPIWAIEPSYYS